MMSFCMVAAQGVMLPIAILVGRNTDNWGRRPLFLAAFAVLPNIRVGAGKPQDVPSVILT